MTPANPNLAEIDRLYLQLNDLITLDSETSIVRKHERHHQMFVPFKPQGPRPKSSALKAHSPAPAAKPKVTPPSKKRFGGADTYIASLRKRGWKELGSGLYSTTFACPKNPNIVAKVCRGKPDGYPLWLYWMNRHFKDYLGIAPKLYSFVYYPSNEPDGHGWYVAFVERVAIMEGTEKWNYNVRKLCQSVVHISSFNEKYPGVPNVMKMIESNFRRDTHPGNMGLRDDMSFVLTDPVTGPSNDTSKAALEELLKARRFKRNTEIKSIPAPVALAEALEA